MSTIIAGISKQQNIGFIASDTSFIVKKRFGNQLGKMGSKIFPLGDKALISFSGSCATIKEVLRTIQWLTDPEDIIKKIVNTLEPKRGRERLRAFMVYTSPEGFFRLCDMNGFRFFETRREATDKELNQNIIPYTASIYEEEHIANKLPYLYSPFTKEVERINFECGAQSAIELSRTIVEEMADTFPRLCDKGFHFWTISRDDVKTKEI